MTQMNTVLSSKTGDVFDQIFFLKEQQRKKAFNKYQEDFSLTDDELHKPLLDVCAGPGDFVAYVKKNYGNTSACSVDYHDRGSVESRKDGNMIKGRAQLLPFADNAFHTVISHNAMTMFYDDRDIYTILREILRVVEGGGRVIFDILSPDQEKRSLEDFMVVYKENNPFDEQHIHTLQSNGEEKIQETISFFEYLESLKKEHHVTISTNTDEKGRTSTTVSIVK